MTSWYVGPNGEGSWADFNGDGIIDGEADFALLKACYLADTGQRPECAKFDLNSSGQVTTSDFTAWSAILSTGFDERTQTQLQSADPAPVVVSDKRWLWVLVFVGLIALKESK